MSKPTLIERLRHHAKNPVVGAIGDEYFHELFDRSADRIAELEAELAEKNEWNVELDQLNIKLMAQIEAVGELPERWQHHLVSDLDASFWNAINLCSDEVKAALNSGVGDE